jgi:hypothetical protein
LFIFAIINQTNKRIMKNLVLLLIICLFSLNAQAMSEKGKKALLFSTGVLLTSVSIATLPYALNPTGNRTIIPNMVAFGGGIALMAVFNPFSKGRQCKKVRF